MIILPPHEITGTVVLGHSTLGVIASIGSDFVDSSGDVREVGSAAGDIEQDRPRRVRGDMRDTTRPATTDEQATIKRTHGTSIVPVAGETKFAPYDITVGVESVGVPLGKGTPPSRAHGGQGNPHWYPNHV
jgi:hypothetical protein